MTATPVATTPTPIPAVSGRDRAPLLPKIAFVLIGLASLVGTALSNRGLGGATLDYLGGRPGVPTLLAAAAVVLAVLLLVGIDRPCAGMGSLVDCDDRDGHGGGGLAVLWRALHLLAFGLWVGGATWNLTVAIPVGIRHPTIEAVTSGALQLQRFRRVARVALPTVVATGVTMALPYLTAVGDLVLTTPGRFIVVKISLIVALVVIFITCPLFRQCSPVAGVCDLDELDTLTRSTRRESR